MSLMHATNLSGAVLRTKKAMDENPDADLVTIVTKRWPGKMSVNWHSQGYEVEVEEREDGIYLYMKKSEASRQTGPG